jgi:hypothetical protein
MPGRCGCKFFWRARLPSSHDFQPHLPATPRSHTFQACLAATPSSHASSQVLQPHLQRSLPLELDTINNLVISKRRFRTLGSIKISNRPRETSEQKAISNAWIDKNFDYLVLRSGKDWMLPPWFATQKIKSVADAPRSTYSSVRDVGRM